ncbi:MAG TPA: peptidoglycan DD-metalloendopeptidase family protein [Solirubrobacterales bacterium]|nr:peptidoglycan DD-metalloendopeptidase family protein [Solirubrobacterales bacterium]
MSTRTRPSSNRLRAGLAIAAAIAAAIAISPLGGAIAQDLQSELDAKRGQLQETRQQAGVLSNELARYTARIRQISGEIAQLRNREAIVAARLEEVKARLAAERERLEALRKRLRRSIKVLSDRLVAIYKSDEPDALTVILNSDGFSDLLERYEYLRRIEEQDSAVVDRVRTLRDQTRETVERIEAHRNEIEARQAELARTRSQLEQREAQLASVRQQKSSALSQVRSNQQRLEGDIEGLEGRIQRQLAAAAAASAPEPAAPLPAGPVQGAPSSSGFIWPVNGPVTSPFGPRWGRMHEGIDIAVPAGTPIRAVKDGTIAFASATGGYGNYTCINHAGGIASCYAHQSSYAVTSGSVSQGQVIGYVGCTGHCFGDHLHFEIRVNGTAVDPLGYL